MTATCSASGACSGERQRLLLRRHLRPGQLLRRHRLRQLRHRLRRPHLLDLQRRQRQQVLRRSGERQRLDRHRQRHGRAARSRRAAPSRRWRAPSRRSRRRPRSGRRSSSSAAASGPTDLVASDSCRRRQRHHLAGQHDADHHRRRHHHHAQDPGHNKGNVSGFQLQNSGSGIAGNPTAPLTLNGNSHAAGVGIVVNPAAGSTNTFNVSNVTIQNTGGVGIRVTAGNADHRRRGRRRADGAADGLLVGGGHRQHQQPVGHQRTQTLFTGNDIGIEANATGSVNIVGTPTSVPSNNGTVLVELQRQRRAPHRPDPRRRRAGGELDQRPRGLGERRARHGARRPSLWRIAGQDPEQRASEQRHLRRPDQQQRSDHLGGLRRSRGWTSALSTDAGHNYLQAPFGGAGVNGSGGLCVGVQQLRATPAGSRPP